MKTTNNSLKFLKISGIFLRPGVVACTCNPANLEAEFWNGVGLIPLEGSSPSIAAWLL